MRYRQTDARREEVATVRLMRYRQTDAQREEVATVFYIPHLLCTNVKMRTLYGQD